MNFPPGLVACVALGFGVLGSEQRAPRIAREYDFGALKWRNIGPNRGGRVHLFQPRVVLRSLNSAVMDYYLQRATDQVTIDILNATGHLVRSFSDKLARKAGTNRFVWDLHYPGPEVFKGIVLRGASPDSGPIAPPGTHQVRLTAMGKTYTQPLAIRKHPRLTDVTDEDLWKQFDLAIQARDKTSQEPHGEPDPRD